MADWIRMPNMVGDVAIEEIIGPHNGGMICERHPEREWPHSDPSESDGHCSGPGMPLSARLGALKWLGEENRRLKDYCALLERGLGAHEARATVWGPEESQSPHD